MATRIIAIPPNARHSGIDRKPALPDRASSPAWHETAILVEQAVDHACRPRPDRRAPTAEAGGPLVANGTTFVTESTPPPTAPAAPTGLTATAASAP